MISSFNEYQELAMKTAVYPNIGSNLAYPVLGFIDETGEFLVANTSDKYSEQSDRVWYIAAIATEIGAELDDVANHLDLGCDYDIFLPLSYLAGIAKKAMRDNGGKVQDSKLDLALYSLAVVFFDWRSECDQRGWNLLEIMQYNLDKLADRQARDAIRGDGDYR